MPDEISRVLFTGDFDSSEFSRGVDGMVASLKKAQAQGDVSNETLQKMQGAIDGVTVAAVELQKVTGKGIAPSLNDGKALQAVNDVSAGFDKLGDTVTKTVSGARTKLNELIAAQKAYKTSIEESNAILKANAAEYASISKQLTGLKASEQGAGAEALKLNAQLKGLNANTAQFQSELTKAKAGLESTTTQIRLQTTAVADSERGANKLKNAVSNITDANSIAARELNGITRRILSIGSVFAFGAIVEGVTALISVFKEFSESSNKTQAVFNEITKAATKSIDVGKIDLLKAKLNDLSLPEKERLEDAKEYNKIADVQNKLDLKQIDNLNAINPLIDRQIELIKERAIATAAANVISEKAGVLFKAQLDFDQRFPELDDKNIKRITDKAQAAIADAQKRVGNLTGGKSNINELFAFVDLPEADIRVAAEKNQRLIVLLDDSTRNIVLNAKRQLEAINQYRSGIKAGGGGAAAAQALINEAQKDLDDTIAFANGLVTSDGLTTKDKIAKGKKEREDDFEKRKAEFLEQISKLAASEFQSELTIRKAYADKLQKALDDIGRDNTITASEDAQLRKFAEQLNSAELDKALSDFHKKLTDEQRKINDEIAAINLQASTARISNIKDDFEREKETIENQATLTTEKLKQERDKQIRDAQKEGTLLDFPQGFIDQKIAEINSAYASLLDQLEITKNQKLQKLAFDTFEKLSDESNRILSAGNLGISQGSLINIAAQTKLFLTGRITYQQYQRDLTQIARAEANERFDIEKQFLQAEIKVRQDELANDKSLTDDQVKRLQDEIRRLQQQLADAEKGNAITGASNTKADRDQRLTDLAKYAQAIGQVAQSVISFWQQANEAEQKALDRSIALQDRRVAAAQQIAARGNAEYLRLEEERQQQLLIKQENAARRTLAINAALQASQLIVALISGIAQGAKVGGGLGAIIEVGAIVAAIAGAYAIAQSLKPVQPSFFIGTEDTGPGGKADNKGGFQATLHPHERIVSAEENKHLKGITNKQLIETVNQHKIMVENWASKPAPQLNLAAMDMATSVSATQNVRLAAVMEDNNRKLDENNQLQKHTHYLLKNMESSIVVNEHGMALSVNKVLDRLAKSKKM